MSLKKIGIRFAVVAAVVGGAYLLIFGLPAYMDQRAKARQDKFSSLQSLLQEHSLLLAQLSSIKTADSPPSIYDADAIMENLKDISSRLSDLLKSPDKRLDADTVAVLRSIPATTVTFNQDYQDARAIAGKAAAYFPENDINGSNDQKKSRADATTNALTTMRSKLHNPSQQFIASLDNSISCFDHIRNGDTNNTRVNECTAQYKNTRNQAVIYILSPIEVDQINRVESNIKTIQQKIKDS